MKQYLFLLLAAFAACTKSIHSPTPGDTSDKSITPSLIISEDRLTATITTDPLLSEFDSLSTIAKQPISWEDLINIVQPELHDSSKVMAVDFFAATLTNLLLGRSLERLEKYSHNVVITYSVDTSAVMPHIRNGLSKMGSITQPIEPLFDRGGHIPDFSLLSPSIQLLLPGEDLNVPRKASRLPNAPRAYRSGIHRGIDFFSNWGTPVKAVADGIIIRSDLNYEEVPADFRVEILKRAAKLDRTPSDIFNAVLLGKAVVIDHGFNLFPGFRSITIYAHLSNINSNIKPGYNIKAGDIFAQSGNTGTLPSTMGTRGESHLHWELILQDTNGEYYFGQNMPYEKLYPSLKSLFNN
ncbi:MAG: M23 family metallopeptidase [Candidatus Marinimicrobia bacterium]|nr:M23 family metallopeptidase [Candidatus Neomarinimicrobiota bacterium]